ncbi:hypothetical protein B0H67DRAFT_99423 [Lasiosphaeris hirsuta]|uniref:Uncharacterized protein n=1 Tax=Lasiosphaeris hirsuta TaxID=260670 RepID=A0AA40E4W2_9PEZI|nr:hypothetical protein B0H67DRAFT_99423 [Lasiosphaeris hirsuta]
MHCRARGTKPIRQTRPGRKQGESRPRHLSESRCCTRRVSLNPTTMHRAAAMVAADRYVPIPIGSYRGLGCGLGRSGSRGRSVAKVVQRVVSGECEWLRGRGKGGLEMEDRRGWCNRQRDSSWPFRACDSLLSSCCSPLRRDAPRLCSTLLPLVGRHLHSALHLGRSRQQSAGRAGQGRIRQQQPPPFRYRLRCHRARVGVDFSVERASEGV